MNKICIICKKQFNKPYHCCKKQWAKRLYCSVRCRRIGIKPQMSGKNNPNWKGGTISYGYKILCIKNKRISEHRYVMQNYLGRILKKSESVHHVNGNKLDNRIENLKLFTKSGHNKFHYPKGSLFGKNSFKIN